MPAEDFSIIHASSYAYGAQRGAYLLVGDTVIMTTGPLAGNRYRRLTENFLRKIDLDGRESELRCVRQRLAKGRR